MGKAAPKPLEELTLNPVSSRLIFIFEKRIEELRISTNIFAKRRVSHNYDINTNMSYFNQ